MLIFFAFFFLAFFGLFAVVADLGIARMTQLQMQTSADIAALEGLAGRDAIVGDFAASDLARRETAAAFASIAFDEDLDRSTAADQYLLGAGPQLSTGVGGIADPAGGVLTSDGPWIPSLETNAASNLVNGDLVAGDYAALDPSDPGRVDWHVEEGSYERLDFAPEGSGNAFLARLRRTRDNNSLDRVAGVSSAGPTLPYLFGLGSGVLSTPDASVYDPRRDGVTVRAAAIADARPVTMAGLARPGFPGLAPVSSSPDTGNVRWLSFDQVSWLLLPIDAPFVVQVDASGAVSGSADGAALALSSEIGEESAGPPRLGSVCLQALAGLPIEPPAELTGLMYATLHESLGATGISQVRGFVAVSITNVQVVPGPALRLEGVKLGPTVAPRNASAQRSLVADPTVPLSLPTGAGALLAPVIAR